MCAFKKLSGVFMVCGAASLLFLSPVAKAQESVPEQGGVAESADSVFAKQGVIGKDKEAGKKVLQSVPTESGKSDLVKPAVSALPELPVQDEKTLEKRIELAKRMHEINSTRDQVDSAIKRASMALPDAERAGFIASMQGVLNYHAIEKISEDAMVETFTVEELQAMVEYYSKPEAKSAAKKIGFWASKVQPEIMRMIDKAMLRVRTGEQK